MRLLHDLAKTHASFDDPNLVSHAGLVPVMGLAARCWLADLTYEHVRIGRAAGVNADLKVGCLVAGMAAGADSIDDLDVLRHGAMAVLFGGMRAPSTLGAFLRSFTWGNARQLEAVHRRFLAELARAAPLLPGKDVVTFVDIDSWQKRVFGYSKHGAAFGYTKISGKSLLVRGLNVLAATVSTPLAAPVTAAVRLRGGSAASARGAASFIAEAVGAAQDTGCSGTIVVRMDSAYYSPAAVWAVRRAGAYFSVTAQLNASVQAAIAAIPATAWTPIAYPRALWDDQLGCWVSDAEVAETEYTAFTSHPRGGQRRAPVPLTARLIVRRVRDLNTGAPAGQAELFPVWRYHAVFTDSPFQMLQAEEQHRGHAVIEQVFADWNDGPWPTCRRGRFPPTPPGWPAPPSPATCCAPPPPWPASPSPSPRRHHPPRPHQRRRPHRPPRPRPHHPAPARRLAPRPGMAQPVRSRHRPPRPRGLTSPDPVTATPRPKAARQTATADPDRRTRTSRKSR